jgi:hypothetical protein
MGAKDTSRSIEGFGTWHAGVFSVFATTIQQSDGASFQNILDRISGKAENDTEIIQADTSNTTSLFEQRPLDERKLDHIQLKDGKKPESQSSVSFVLKATTIIITQLVSCRRLSFAINGVTTGHQIHISISRTFPG